jgi:hypothetical protein
MRITVITIIHIIILTNQYFATHMLSFNIWSLVEAKLEGLEVI